MALKTYKPYTPGLRQKTVLSFSEITATKPEKSLTRKLNKKAGRDTFGRISVRRRGESSRRSSTIPTGAPTSPSSSMLTARSATSSLPRD